ncbi:multidrug effflux MFS transporter [Pontivivens ytuae]|uniref:Bcr/CflA family efflux transporter n=1 Tax=Pontivivens ytuae TaxID=2789856 RepID=A0A7S9QE16_9RHOB|nr:multidrug effflux MFS transporter [Pontivivens ytuae]QPH55475.1 multidrug effflux MFS transporter [Pontivivens ytuae]
MTRASPHHAPLGFAGFVAIIAALMGLNAVAIDIMLPGLPEIAAAFTPDDVNRAQLVFSAYLAGFGLAQLAMGVLADRYGRKPVLIGGIAVYAAAGFACAFAPSLEVLLIARFVQGLGSAAPRVVATASVRDCYEGRDMAQVMSLSMVVFMAVPVIAPTLGQLILFVAPWPAVFVFLGLYALFMLWICATRLPETLRPEHRRPIRWASFAAALRSVFGARQTVGYMLAAGMFFGSLFGFINSAQQVLEEVLELGPWFVAVFALIAVAIAVSSLVNAQLVQRFGMRLLSHGAVCLCALFSAILLIGPEGLGVVGFLAVLSGVMLMIGLIFANFNALAMEPQGAVAGIAASVIGSVTALMGAGIGFTIGAAFDGTARPLALGFLVSAVVTIAILAVTERGRLFRSSPAAA